GGGGAGGGRRSKERRGTGGGWWGKPRLLARATKASLASPASDTPERSPLTSAAKTEMPARERPSASTCNVTVLPVPVAPVISPWRLANASVQNSGLTLFPTKIVPSLSRFAMAPFLPDNASLLSLSRVCGQPAAAATEASASWRPHEHARSRSLSHCIG